MELYSLEGFNAIPGHGIEARISGKDLLLGNKRLMDDRQIQLGEAVSDSERLANEGKTPMYVSIDGRLGGIIAVADVLKESSREAVNALHRLGLEVVMVTGDNRRTAEAIARQVGIDRVLAGTASAMSSGDKETAGYYRQEGCHGGGWDQRCPALAQADIGIAIGSGTDVAMNPPILFL